MEMREGEETPTSFVHRTELFLASFQTPSADRQRPTASLHRIIRHQQSQNVTLPCQMCRVSLHEHSQHVGGETCFSSRAVVLRPLRSQLVLGLK